MTRPSFRRYTKWSLLLIIFGCIAIADISSIRSLSRFRESISSVGGELWAQSDSYSPKTKGRTSHQSPTAKYNNQTQIDLVSLTINTDFFILFNNSAIDSWLRHIQNVRSIIFIGPPDDESLFEQNMKIHYPHLVNNNNKTTPIIWVNETYFQETYRQKYKCPYAQVCQQLFKLHVFDLRTKLGVDILDNVLLIDSDTVWSRDVTFVNPENGTVTYFGYKENKACINQDPMEFTEAITAGIPPTPPKNATFPHVNKSQEEDIKMEYFKKQIDYRIEKTVTRYRACRHTSYTESTGIRHIVHHMLFQYDVMTHLHETINTAWDTSSVWEATMKCFEYKHYCTGRVAEFELYYAFVSDHYPERVNLEVLTSGKTVMLGSAICSAEEMECCREKGVLLKGCHDHRLKWYEDDNKTVGDMCCGESEKRKGPSW